jgi:3-deoxy-D-manno-octulosonic-acid transferase
MILMLWEILQKVLYFFAKKCAFCFSSSKARRFLETRTKTIFLENVQNTRISFQKRDEKSGKTLKKIWLHVASAGELEQAIPPMRKLVEENVASVFLTWFSPSTEPFLKNAAFVSGFSTFPLDCRDNHEHIIRTLGITDIVLVRYDFWPALFAAGRNHALRFHLLAATKISSRNNLFSRIGLRLKRTLLTHFNTIFAITQEDFDYFKSLSLNTAIIHAGDPKWSRAAERARSLKINPSSIKAQWFLDWIHGIKGSRKILVFGSPHAEEHSIAKSITTQKDDFLIVYVPHECDDAHVIPIISDMQRNNLVFRFSSLQASALPESADVIVVDRVGFLAEIYSLADIAIVGGGFDGQVHNVLEPAAHPVCTFFGNNIRKAPEAQTLTRFGAAKTFATPQEMTQYFLSLPSHLPEQEPICAKMKTTATRVFSEIPNTNEIVFNAFVKAEPQKRSDLC